MKNYKERYNNYSLIIIIGITGLLILFKLTSFLGGILGAMTIYILLRKQLKYLTQKKRMKKGVAAALLVGETIILFLIPLGLFVNIVIEILNMYEFNPQSLMEPIRELSATIREITGYDLLKTENLFSTIKLIPQIGQSLMAGITSLVVNILILIFVLYFILLDSEQVEKYIYDILPFSDKNKKEVLHEVKMIVTSNALGIPLLAMIQGGIAMLGYLIFDVPHILAFGFLTCITTIIPVVGTGLVWVPLAIFLGINGDWKNAIGLACYGALIISQVDNLIRFMLQKKMAHIHPLITVFGVIIGLPLFGFMGIIFGPLMLSMFILCLNIFKKEYLSN